MPMDRQWVFSRISPELRLLLHCLEQEQGPNRGQKIRPLIRPGMGWDAFIRLVDRHRVPVQAFQRLREPENSAVPPSVLTALQTRARNNQLNAMILSAELVRLVSKFKESSRWPLRHSSAASVDLPAPDGPTRITAPSPRATALP